MPRKKMLIRTDNEDFGHKLGRQLERNGANVDITKSLNDAGEALYQGPKGQRRKVADSYNTNS